MFPARSAPETRPLVPKLSIVLLGKFAFCPSKRVRLTIAIEFASFAPYLCKRFLTEPQTKARVLRPLSFLSNHKPVIFGDVTKVYYNKWNKTLYCDCERTIVDSIANYPAQKKWTQSQVDDFERKHLEVCDDGNVYKWNCRKATPIHKGKIELILSGSPCQSFSSGHYFSYGNDEYGLKGKSGLFYEFLRILKEVNPTYYFFENVKMKKESEKELSDYLGVNALHINSNLLTYQNRDRLYWTNIKGITMPHDANMNFQDYKLRTLPRIEKAIRQNKFGVKKHAIRLTSSELETITSQNLWAYNELLKDNPSMTKKEFVKELHAQLEETTPRSTPYRDKMWDACLTNGKYASKNLDLPTSTKCGALTLKNDRSPSTAGLIAFGDFYRYVTKIEMSKAQGISFSYIKDLSYSQANNVLGDGWTVPIIAHCLSFMD